jgi:hypothetical protein
LPRREFDFLSQSARIVGIIVGSDGVQATFNRTRQKIITRTLSFAKFHSVGCSHAPHGTNHFVSNGNHYFHKNDDCHDVVKRMWSEKSDGSSNHIVQLHANVKCDDLLRASCCQRQRVCAWLTLRRQSKWPCTLFPSGSRASHSLHDRSTSVSCDGVRQFVYYTSTCTHMHFFWSSDMQRKTMFGNMIIRTTNSTTLSMITFLRRPTFVSAVVLRRQRRFRSNVASKRLHELVHVHNMESRRVQQSVSLSFGKRDMREFVHIVDYTVYERTRD